MVFWMDKIGLKKPRVRGVKRITPNIVIPAKAGVMHKKGRTCEACSLLGLTDNVIDAGSRPSMRSHGCAMTPG